ncbi:multicopper oxidase domain-containing protein [Kineococcus sp. G2]|uniref:multicopper oxidase domain-containing protein n=1 Tax=Kineococcus sp. G2 TaxID=3127484 RepID=UPI00301BA409
MNRAPGRPPAAGRPRRRRTDRFTTLWLLAALVTTAVGLTAPGALPQPFWTMIHVVALGVLTNAVLQWSWYFARALLHLPAADARAGRDNAVRSVAFNALLVALVAAMWVGSAWATPVLAGAVGAVIAWHGLALLRASRTRLASRFAVVVRYYVVAAAFLVLGCVLAGMLTVALFATGAPAWLLAARDRLTLAHALVNVAGWLGLSMAGTLVTLGPTVLRTRMAPDAVERAVAALPWFTGAILLAAASATAGWVPGIGVGVVVYGGALVGGVVVPLVRAASATTVRSYPATTLAAGLAWLLVGLAAVAVNAFTSADATELRTANLPWLPLLGGAGLAQVFVGALTYLMPVVIGGGPAVVRRGVAVLESAGPLRWAARNTALLLLAVASGAGGAPRALWWLVLACFAADVVLFARAGARQARARREAAAAGPPGPEPVSITPAPVRPPAQQPPANTSRPGLAVAGVLVAVVVATAASLTDPGPVGPAGADASGATSAGAVEATAAAAVTPTGHTTEVTLRVDGMSFTPSSIEVPAGDELRVTLVNTGDQRHDLVFDGGAALDALAPGASGTLDVGVLSADAQGWCSLPGHRQMGMVVQVDVVGAPAQEASTATAQDGTQEDEAPSAAALQRAAADAEPRAAELPPLTDATEHHETFTVTEQVEDVAEGISRTVWTYDGTSPGPVLHGRIGDTFRITLVNDGTLGHSIDFHAGELAPDGPMRTIEPGESLEYAFTATRAGVWMYHCSTTPMSNHIANGMFGAVVIEPDGLEPVDRSYVLVQSENYLGADGEPADAAEVAGAVPDVTAFNGRAFQYDAHPLTAGVGERVRLWVLDAGPNSPLAFHVVGAQFDTVWSEGAYRVRNGASTDGATTGSTGSQTLSLLPAEGGFVELVAPEAGDYPFVNHVMSLAEKGAHGVLRVG